MNFNRTLRCLCVFISLVFLINSLLLPTSAIEFDDTYVGMLDREFFDAINYVSDNGWMNGTDSSHFSPYEEITRGMFVTLLYRYSGSQEQFVSNFTDVPTSSYYYYPIGWANNYGIVNGITTTTFEPETVITKEQMAVMLYRYAKNYEGKSYVVSSFSSITCHPDYSSVSLYAMEALRWAKTYHVFPLTNANSYISPRANMNRAYSALYIANYSREVTGFTTEDIFSFSHSSDNFNYSVSLSTRARQLMFSYIENYYGSNTTQAKTDKEKILQVIGTEWGGSCFGIASVTLFDKLGKVDFDRNCAINATSMSTVGRPISYTSTVESAINYYQLLHYIYAFSFMYEKFLNALPSGMETTYQYIHDNGVTPFAYFWQKQVDGTMKTYGHAFLITDISKEISGSSTIYHVTALDPNHQQNGLIEHTITSSGSYVFLQETQPNGSTLTRQLTKLYFYPKESCDFLDNFDIDGDHNNQKYLINSPLPNSAAGIDINSNQTSYTQTSMDSFSPYEIATIRVPYVEFIISNSSGETLVCDGVNLGGSMEVLSQIAIPNGEFAPADLIITVRNSSSFSFINQNNDYVYFGVSSPFGFSSISGYGITTAIANLSETVLSVEGTGMAYSAWIETGLPGYEYFYIRGENNTDFDLSVDNQNIVLNGLSGVQNCGFSSSDFIITEVPPTIFSGGNYIDLSAISREGTVQVDSKP